MDKKIKLLVISDDIRIKSGVGIQCKKILTGLLKTGKYDIVELGGSLNIQVKSPEMIDGIKVYSTNGESYGTEFQLRYLISIEKPDIILAFSDPRFFSYLFQMDNEIREHSKLIFYHTWDNDPFPKFNLPFYSACDGIVMISEFSHELMKSGGVECINIPHMQNAQEFYPLSKKEIDKEIHQLKQLVGLKDIDFIIFYNNRNLDRKRPGDVINIFTKFYKTHPNSVLLMNTSYVDPEGTDLGQLQKEFVEDNIPIIFSINKITSEKLNMFYNVADVTINIAYQEGFGLCVSESLLTGTPVIATQTGGMTEQMHQLIHHEEIRCDETGLGCGEYVEDKVFGVLIPPKVRNLFGVPGAAYIYKDFVSDEDVLFALEQMYSMKFQKSQNNDNISMLEELGLRGREFISKKYNEETIIKKWDEYLTEMFNTPSSYKKVKLFKI